MPPTPFEDALADLATPAAYVPRLDMERARLALEKGLSAGGLALLTGDPGSGKTLLLRRLAAFPPPGVRAVYVPFLHLGPGEYAPWLLFLMGEEEAADPAAAERRLLEVFGQGAAEGRRTWLLIDESPAIPRATAARLAQLMGAFGGRLGVALAATSRSAVRELLDCFGAPAASAHLSGGIDEQATSAYVQALVGRAAPEERDRARRAAARLGPLAERVPRDVKAELLPRWRELGEAPPPAEPPAEEAAPSGARPPEPAADLPLLALPLQAPEAAEPPRKPLDLAIQEIEAELDLAEFTPAPPEAPPHPPASSPAAGARVPPEARPRPAPRRRKRPARAGARPSRPAAGGASRATRRPIAPLVVALVAVGLLGAGLWLLRGRRPASSPPPVPAAATAGAPLAPAATSSAAAAPLAKVEVNVNAAPWARIRVDGRELGVTPLGGVPLDAGSHVFQATFPDGRVVSRTVAVSPDHRFVVFR